MTVEPLPETSLFAAMRRFDCRDGGLGLPWPEKCVAATNRQAGVGRGTFCESLFGAVKWGA